MRRLLESLVPDGRPIYWKWVGGVFALYVVLLISAAGAFLGHETTRKLAHEPGMTVAVGGKSPSTPAVTPVRQFAHY